MGETKARKGTVTEEASTVTDLVANAEGYYHLGILPDDGITGERFDDNGNEHVKGWSWTGRPAFPFGSIPLGGVAFQLEPETVKPGVRGGEMKRSTMFGEVLYLYADQVERVIKAASRKALRWLNKTRTLGTIRDTSDKRYRRPDPRSVQDEPVGKYLYCVKVKDPDTRASNPPPMI